MDYSPLTLGWFLHHTSIDNLEFIGSSSALSEPITGINVLDNPDGIHWIKKNELVLSTGYIFKDDPEMQKRIIKELSEINCTAFCIKVKRFFDRIPDLMIEEAKKYRLPLVAVPFYHSYADIMDVVFRQLAGNDLLHQKYILDQTEHLYQLLFQNEGIIKMLEHLSQVTGAAVMVTTLTDIPLYHYIPAYDSLLFPESSELSIRAVPSSQEEVDSFRTCTFYFNQHAIEFTTFLLPNRTNYLCIDTSRRLLTAMAAEVTTHSLPVIALQLENIQQSNRYQPSRNYYDSFFNLLSDIQSKSVEEIKMICSTYGFRYDGKKVCIVIEASPEIFQHRPFKQFYVDVDHKLKSLVKNYFLCFHEYRIVIYLFYAKNHPGLQAMNHAAYIAEQLFMELSEYQNNLQIGISRSHTRITSIASAYEESLRAIYLQTFLNRPERISSSLDQTPYYLLEKISSYEMKKLYRDTIMILVQYDKENNTELIHTLKAYYRCRLNISETAKSLFLHRNTLTSRLNLIKEILGLNLESIEEVFTIYLGICAYELTVRES